MEWLKSLTNQTVDLDTAPPIYLAVEIFCNVQH